MLFLAQLLFTGCITIEPPNNPLANDDDGDGYRDARPDRKLMVAKADWKRRAMLAGGALAVILSDGAVRRMRTRIGLLAQPESMRSIIGATQREQTTRNL